MGIFLEVTLFLTAVIGVVILGIVKSRKVDESAEGGASGYFLAGRGLSWWLVGFSLIAANISTEQFVGMSGSSANWLGMAIASYEWMAAVTLVIVAFFFLPRFLRAGLYTIPEFLQYRFDGVARLSMAIPAIVTLVLVTTSSVIFSGAKFVSEYYSDVPVINNLAYMCWFIAAIAAIYVFIGGLKACAWTDMIWGSALILGGVVVLIFAMHTLAERPAEELILTKVANSNATIADLEGAGAWERLKLLNDGVDGEAKAVHGPNGSGGKLHMVRPKEDSDIPWTALLIGLWIPNFFYWGLNQYIVQRTLGAKSLAEGQKGIVFAAGLKLIIPFIVVIPGILAFNLFSGDLMRSAETRNAQIMANVSEIQAVQVRLDFVENQPDLASLALAHNTQVALNSQVAGVPEIPTEVMLPEEMAHRINLLASQIVDAGGRSAGTLFGYDYDAAFPVLVRNLISPHPWISWFVLAALSGAVISSLASMLNSASTIATMDLYARFAKVDDQKRLVFVGRSFVILFVLIAAIVAPMLDRFDSIFAYIQEFQGFISPGILAVFIFGFFSPRTPRWFGVVGILTNILCYGGLKLFGGQWLVDNGLWYADQVAFLDRMGICFFIVILMGVLITLIKPMEKPVVLPVNEKIELVSSPGAKIVGWGIIVATLCLYVVFW